MNDLNPRIRTALVSVNPTSKNPAWHGAATALGILCGASIRVGFEQWKTGWPARADTVDEGQWKAEVGLLKSTHARLVDAVTAFDPAMLDCPLGKQTTRNAIEYIHGIGEHSLHHATQIEMIKSLAKQQGIG